MDDFFDEQLSEVERYELREPRPYWFAANRREFTQILGAGLLVAVSAGDGRAQRHDANEHDDKYRQCEIPVLQSPGDTALVEISKTLKGMSDRNL